LSTDDVNTQDLFESVHRYGFKQNYIGPIIRLAVSTVLCFTEDIGYGYLVHYINSASYVQFFFGPYTHVTVELMIPSTSICQSSVVCYHKNVFLRFVFLPRKFYRKRREGLLKPRKRISRL